MRELTSHKVNGLNESICIEVFDEPGQGGACHEYGMRHVDSPDHYDVRINFQNGPLLEEGYNGISQEALLAIVEDRLKCFQAGPYATGDNAEALAHVQAAMECLHRRTKERMARGVEGTHAR